MASFPGQKSTGAPLPNTVSMLSAVEQSATSVLLSWLSAGGATSYNLYRGGTLLATAVLTTTYTDNTVVANTTYSYTVQGVNALGAGNPSQPAVATTPPAQVTGLVATALSSSSIGTTWTATPGANTYTVDRGGTPVGTPATNAFTDTGLSPSTAYTYTVAANGAGGQGAFSSPASATTQSASGSYAFHPGHGFWLDNHDWPGNQKGLVPTVVSAMNSLPSYFNRLELILPWAGISDAALTGGVQTFSTFRTNLTDMLTTVNNAAGYNGTSGKKYYISLKFWQGAFPGTTSGTIASVSGNTVTLDRAVGGNKIMLINGSQAYNITSASGMVATLSSAPGAVAEQPYEMAAAKMPDSEYWPAWMPTNWVKVFFQPNSNAREQLDYDNNAVWAALLAMFQGMANVINSLDTFNQIDTINTADESVVASVAQGQVLQPLGGTAVCNASNYNSQFTSLHLSLNSVFPTRTVVVPLSYLPDDTNAGMQAVFSALESANPGRYAYQGPDPCTFGTHGNTGLWYNTFQNVVTGTSGGYPDLRTTVLKIGHVETQSTGTSGTNPTPPPPGSTQRFYNDVMTLNNIAVNGSIPAHIGYGCNTHIWNWENDSSTALTPSVVQALVQANSGSVSPMPPGNWNFTP